MQNELWEGGEMRGAETNKHKGNVLLLHKVAKIAKSKHTATLDDVLSGKRTPDRGERYNRETRAKRHGVKNDDESPVTSQSVGFMPRHFFRTQEKKNS